MTRGCKPGERRGGRQRGTPNKSTEQKRRLAEQILARTLPDARVEGRMLAKDVLSSIMHEARALADACKADDPDRYERLLKFAADCASELAPFESPRFAAHVALAAPGRDGYRINNPDEKVEYRSLESIREELKRRGLPSYREVMREPVTVEAEAVEVDAAAPKPVNGGDRS